MTLKRIAASALFTLAALLPSAASAQPHVFTMDTHIPDTEFMYDGMDIVVQGCTVTIDGEHSFRSLTIERSGNRAGVVTHTQGFSNGIVEGFHLLISGNCTIEGPLGGVGSRIDVNGRGYVPANGPGRGVSGASGGGGGHGGAGGDASTESARGGGTYALIDRPIQLGSGGGNDIDNKAAGGFGGGVVRLTVAGTLNLHGNIWAKGTDGSAHAGGGAGGSVLISAGTIVGVGGIIANGGNAHAGEAGGGGGGRIAIQHVSGTLSPSSYTAFGGNGRQTGGAGTVWLRQSGWLFANLLISNGPVAPGATTEINGPTTLDVNLTVGPGAVVGPPRIDPPQALDLRINGDATVELGGAIAASRRGHPKALGEGKGISGNAGSGAGHGGAGGDASSSILTGGITYGSITDPIRFGSGGGNDLDDRTPGGAGGGVVLLTVRGTLRLDGDIRVNGGEGGGAHAGGGSGGSIVAHVGAITGNGAISANGGNAHVGAAGGGGGGRIAVYFDSSTLRESAITAYGGSGWQRGGAGTVYLRQSSRPLADLVIDNGGVAGATTEFNEPATFDANLIVRNGGIVGPARATPPQALDLMFTGNATIEFDGQVSASGRGFGPEHGPGKGGSAIAGGGGGYGGAGGDGSVPGATGGIAYGSATTPINFGSGGGNDLDNNMPGGFGGGVLRLAIGETLRVDGRILANGQDGLGAHAGGGSGGSILISAGTFTGGGAIRADGGIGRGGGGGGGGGGGRVAIYVCSNAFNMSNVRAAGGSGFEAGEEGSVFESELCPTATPISSSFPAEAAWVPGTLTEQVARLNAGPAGVTWHAARAKLDDHRPSSFECGGLPAPLTPLDEPFVSTNTPIHGVHEVTLDNCRSAFYRFTFLMPPAFHGASLSGIANADDIGIVFLNGVAISPAMRASDLCLPNGCDRCEQGRCVLTWPNADAFGTTESSLFRPGVNELVFGICGDASPYEPTGLEFEAVVSFTAEECYADCDPSTGPGTLDIFDFLCFQNRFDAQDPYACDCDVSSGPGTCDIFDFLCFQNAYDAGCP